MYTKVEKLNMLIRGSALLLLLMIMFFFVYQIRKEQVASVNDLTIIVKKTYQQLIKKELRAFKSELSENYKIYIQIASDDEVLNQFRKDSKAMVILPRKLSSQEQSNLNSDRLPLKQDLLATGMVNSPIKELYLIQDDQVTDLEKKFDHFLFSSKGQDIFFREGYISAKMGFSQH